MLDVKLKKSEADGLKMLEKEPFDIVLVDIKRYERKIILKIKKYNNYFRIK